MAADSPPASMTQRWRPLLTGRREASGRDESRKIHPRQSVEVNGSDESNGRCADKPHLRRVSRLKRVRGASLFGPDRPIGACSLRRAGSCTGTSRGTCVNVVRVTAEGRVFGKMFHSVVKKKNGPIFILLFFASASEVENKLFELRKLNSV